MIIVLEGITCSGKTTYFELLKKDYPEFVFMPEVATILARKGYEIAERTSEETEKKIIEAYIENHIEAVEQSKKGKICVFDRNYISALTYSYVRWIQSGFTDGIIKMQAEKIQELKKEYDAPDYYIHLMVGASTAVSRTYKRNDPSIATNLDPTFLTLMEKFYSQIMHNLENSSTWLPFRTNVGTIDSNYRTVKTIVEGCISGTSV